MMDFPLIRVFRRASVTSPSPGRFRGATYYFDVKNPNNVEKGVAYLEVDGRHVDGNVVPVEDGKTEYHVTVHME